MKSALAILCLASNMLFAQADDFFGKLPTLPEEVVERVNNWLLAESDLIKKLVVQEGVLGDYKAKHKENNKLLKEKGIVNASRSNYVFVCPVASDYFVKISGPVNRLVNMVVANGKWPTSVTDEEIKELRHIVTYQTVSSLPTYYLYLRLQHTKPLKHVYIPKTYLFKVPNAPEFIADTNYIILQERISLLPKDESKKLVKQLNDDQINELIFVVASCGLWDIKNNIRVAQDGKLVIVDLEQPNISNPLKGFNIQEFDRFNSNVNCGLRDLKKLLGREDILPTIQ